MVELSRIWRIWGEDATEKELEKCMNGAKAIKMDNNADKYYIFPEIVEKAYGRIEKKIRSLEEELEKKNLRRLHLESELEVLGDLYDVWHESWSEAELCDSKEGISIDKIQAFISSTFTSKEETGHSSIENDRDEIANIRKEIKMLKSTFDNLFPYYSMIERGR